MRDPDSGIRRPEGGTSTMPRNALKQYKQKNTPAYDQAVDNVLADLWHAAINPHGNITKIAQRALAKTCCGGDIPDFETEAATLRSPQPASGANPCRPTPAEPLRRVVPYSWFLAYHLKSNSPAQSTSPAPARRGNFTTIRNLSGHMPGKTPAAGSAKNLLRVHFRGRVGQPNHVTWWTFGPSSSRPNSGYAYMMELALPESGHKAAEACKMVVEITIAPGVFPVELFKPSALDGFCAYTRFSPDHSDAPHGWTKPDPSYAKRPELVSESFAYHEIDKKVREIAVVFLPYCVKSHP